MTYLEDPATEATKARYGRLAPIYDFVEVLPELRYRSWRERFWEKVRGKLSRGERLLEVGVGTGKNLPHWPQGIRISAIDLTPGMVARARRWAAKLGLEAEIVDGDVQRLEFPDDSFDVAVATFVFCSVPNPLLGLRELARVVRPGGLIFLMEHVRSRNPLMGKLMDLLNPLVVRLMGLNINRDTVGNVIRSGLMLDQVEDLGKGGIFKIIHAHVSFPHEGGNA
ncbi:MAG: methyltransferase domain-containing protein [Anaerolineales bacterium]|nr:methyltransferase domain-containing protein [Anaerolineales bacterium]